MQKYKKTIISYYFNMDLFKIIIFLTSNQYDYRNKYRLFLVFYLFIYKITSFLLIFKSNDFTSQLHCFYNLKGLLLKHNINAFQKQRVNSLYTKTLLIYFITKGSRSFLLHNK